MNPTPEQQLAIDTKGSNIIVSAGAGSGKTAVLTQRTMRIINDGIHINELLILTFTKAAAAEMKERIRKALKKASVNNNELLHELELIDQSYITTFDSFALSVVKKYHYLLNLPKNIGISDSSIIDMQKIKIMDEVFESNYENPTEDFTKLIYDFCVKDDKDIKNQIRKIADNVDKLTNRDEYLNTYIDNYCTDNFINNILNEYEEIVKKEITEIEKLAFKLSFLVDSDYNNKIIEALTPLYSAKNIDEIYNIIGLIKIPQLPKGSDDTVKNAKKNLNNVKDKLKDTIYKYGNKNNIINNIKSSYCYVNAIVKIVKEYLTKLHNYKRENELYDFQDIALLSIQILKENEFVRKELKDTFKEIMIDEYQDTNDIQETFISMIENNNVYMVGDVKQSIYRFRNANPYIFKDKYDNYSQNKGGVKIDLVKNFRSRKEVLNNINDVFKLIMDNAIGGAEYHESHEMYFGNENYIKNGLTNYNYNFRILEYETPEDKKYSKEEIEIFSIVKDIKEKITNNYQVFDKDSGMLRNINYSDIVILMDRSTDFDLYKKIFEYNGIPLTLYKDPILNNSDDIYILKNIVNYIIKLSKKELDTEFQYAYTSIARSYLYNISDQEIFNSFKSKDFKNNKVYEDFINISNNLNNKDITSIVEEIISITNMYEKIITLSNIDNTNKRIDILLDIATNLNNLGYDIYSFRDYLNEILDQDYQIKYKEAKSDSNSVKIMTIHTSKGLEYPICYYSGLYKEFNIRDVNDRFLLDNNYGIITPYFNEGINELVTKYIYKYHYLEEEVGEKIRLFYVALTRAREQMIVLLPKIEEEDNDLEENNTINSSIRRNYLSFADIMNSIKSKIIKYYEDINIHNLNLTKEYLFNKTKDNNIGSSIETFEVNEITPISEIVIEPEHYSKNTHELITKEIKNNMNFGLDMHEALELIDFKNPNYDIIENNFIKDKVKRFLSNDIIKKINESNIYKEYEFIYEKENKEYHGIIDLMMEYEDHIDIIDYKLNNIKDENYLKQLNGYKEYINSISDKPVNIYLYSIISETLEKL
ncbi:MAG: UvrD-helicase domain-containing protein [Candidatus Coprovivens sp.]